jgi:hypothetical protein
MNMRARFYYAGLVSIAVVTAALGAGATAAHADTATCLGLAATVHSEAVIDAGVGVIRISGDGPHTIVWHGGNVVVCGTGADHSTTHKLRVRCTST